MNENNKVFGLSDEELAKVVGGWNDAEKGTTPPKMCPEHYTHCDTICLNANCGHLILCDNEYHCDNGVPRVST